MNERAVKVIHSSYQDIELIEKHLGCLPCNIFDTQIAAQFCGFGTSVSYEALVRHYCSIELDKSSQFTNWLQRPLSSDQLSYALNDVKYLGQVYDGMVGDLKAKGYQEWALEEMLHLQNPAKYQVNVDEIWRKIKLNVLTPDFLGRLQALARAREILAMKRNKPRGHIIKDDLLSLIAFENPSSLMKFFTSKNKLYQFIDYEIISFLGQALEEFRELPAEKYPQLPIYQKLSHSRKEKIKYLKELLFKVSEETGIASSLIARTKEIESLVRYPQSDSKIFQGWRLEVFGKRIMQESNKLDLFGMGLSTL